MQQTLSPKIAIAAIAGLIVIVGAVFFFVTRSPAGSSAGQSSSGAGIPPDIQKEIGARMGGVTAPAKGGQPQGGAPAGMMPPGAPGGMIAPPAGAAGMGGR